MKFNFNNNNTVGYWWLSDETSPRILSEENTFYNDSDNLPLECPFIVEGFFYNPDEHQSWHIRFSQGKYFIGCTGVDGEDLENAVSFIGERGLGKLLFTQKWAKVKTCAESGDGFETFIPVEPCFVGFEK